MCVCVHVCMCVPTTTDYYSQLIMDEWWKDIHLQVDRMLGYNTHDICVYICVICGQVPLVSRRHRESRSLWRRNERSWSLCWGDARQASPESEKCTGSEQREIRKTEGGNRKEKNQQEKWKRESSVIKWRWKEGKEETEKKRKEGGEVK